MALRIRSVTTDDICIVKEMARAMRAESPRYRDRNFSENKVERIISMMVQNIPNMLGLIVYESENNRIIGMAGGIIGEDFFGDDKYFSDFVIYISPEYRGSWAAPRLIRAVENWAWKNHAIETSLGVSTGIHMENTVALYEKLGYQICSVTLVKNKESVQCATKRI